MPLFSFIAAFTFFLTLSFSSFLGGRAMAGEEHHRHHGHGDHHGHGHGHGGGEEGILKPSSGGGGSCTHPQVCSLVFQAQKALGVEGAAPSLVFVQGGDPHHFSPSPKLIKTLAAAPVLYTPHPSLWPWGQKILEQRGKSKDLQTFTLGLPPSFRSGGATSQEAVAHFWLSPKAYCHAFRETVNYVRSRHPGGTTAGAKRGVSVPPCPYDNLGRRLQEAFAKSKRPFVLNHDALAPLLEEYSVPYFSLRTSHHHAELGVKELKRARKFLANHPSVYWIKENQIKGPKIMLKMKRETDKYLELDTLGKVSDAKAPLELFVERLERTL